MASDLFDKDFLKKLEYLELIARRLVLSRREALRLSVRKGASIEFKDFREYSPGDDPRTVDWSVYGRLGELVVKLYRQEQELNLWLLLDCSGSMRFGEPDKFDYARRLAAALAYIGMADMDSASVLPYGEGLQPGRQRLRGRGQVFGLLDYLSDLPAGGRTDLSTAVREFVARVRRPGLVTVISDFYGLQECRKAIDVLRFHKHQVYIIQVACPWEFAPSIRGEFRLVDTESSEFADVVVSDAMLRRYTAAFTGFSEELRSYCMRYGIGCSLARTETPFDEFLTSVLKRGGLVA